MSASAWFYKWGVTIVLLLLMLVVAAVLYFMFAILPEQYGNTTANLSNANITPYLI